MGTEDCPIFGDQLRDDPKIQAELIRVFELTAFGAGSGGGAAGGTCGMGAAASSATIGGAIATGCGATKGVPGPTPYCQRKRSTRSRGGGAWLSRSTKNAGRFSVFLSAQTRVMEWGPNQTQPGAAAIRLAMITMQRNLLRLHIELILRLRARTSRLCRLMP